MNELKMLTSSLSCSLYEIADGTPSSITRLVASTPETRAIANDPFVVGLRYTESLKAACAKVLQAIVSTQKSGQVSIAPLLEDETVVLHILRGGLNFGLREAFGIAHGWSNHGSAFISAQRARQGVNSEDWHITEDSYQKVYLPKVVSLVFGDVVATGTSLEYAIKRLLSTVEQRSSSVKSIVFFTIGGNRSEEILAMADAVCRERFPEYLGATVVYLEGRFAVADLDSKLSIRLTGTDLVRCGSLMAPEFIASQYERPEYPLERCTIYDAGSRAFWIPEYIEDVHDYWSQTLELALSGLTFAQLLHERFPELDQSRFGDVDLAVLCKGQLTKCFDAGFKPHSETAENVELAA